MRITASVISTVCLFFALATGAASAQSIVSLTPKTMSFFVSDGKSATERATLTNHDTTLEATINSIGIGTQCCGEGQFKVISHTCGTTLAPAQHCSITVEFTAQGAEETKSSLIVKFHIDGVAQTETVALTGVPQ